MYILVIMTCLEYDTFIWFSLKKKTLCKLYNNQSMRVGLVGSKLINLTCAFQNKTTEAYSVTIKESKSVSLNKVLV